MTEFSSGEFQDFMKSRKPKKRKNKMNADRCRCNLGHMHDSIDEAHCCVLVYAMFKGEIIEPQKTLRLYSEGDHICNHRVDWLITFKDLTQEIIEYKGFATELWRIKKKLTEACYPHIKYTVMQKKDLL